jgi:hypothetical protein
MAALSRVEKYFAIFAAHTRVEKASLPPPRQYAKRCMQWRTKTQQNQDFPMKLRLFFALPSFCSFCL